LRVKTRDNEEHWETVELFSDALTFSILDPFANALLKNTLHPKSFWALPIGTFLTVGEIFSIPFPLSLPAKTMAPFLSLPAKYSKPAPPTKAHFSIILLFAPSLLLHHYFLSIDIKSALRTTCSLYNSL
jgi:hypothetical protein